MIDISIYAKPFIPTRIIEIKNKFKKEKEYDLLQFPEAIFVSPMQMCR